MEAVIERRERLRREGLRRAREFTSCVKRLLGDATAIVVGSYARGDFNAWSDIDVLVIVREAPRNPIERLRAVEECLTKYPRVEPVIISLDDLDRLIRKRNPMLVEAARDGIVLEDDLNIVEEIRKRLATRT